MADRPIEPARPETNERSRRARQRPEEEMSYRPESHPDGDSVGGLLKELTSEGRTLVRQEVELAKTEMSEKLSTFQRNMTSVALGGAVLVAALVVLVNAMSNGMVALLEGWVGLETAAWLGPVILAAVLGLIGWSMVKKGTSTIKQEGVMPHKTVDSLKEDKRWAERKVKA